jgi:hypothetical protein
MKNCVATKLVGLSLWCLLCVLSVQRLAVAQVHVSGTIQNAQTHEAIAAASIGILGTTKGSVANVEGAYTIPLTKDEHVRLRVTAIGYKPDTISITPSRDVIRNIQLTPTPVTSQEITITPLDNRKEGERIIREAIRAKNEWKKDLNTYQFQVYARMNFQTISGVDSTMQSVLESEANGFWSKEKGYAEQIVARRQTANLPAAMNRISLFRVVDFYDDRLDVSDYSLPGPVADDALDFYDADLIGSGSINGEETWTIAIEPRNALIPAFMGKIWISKADYSIQYLDLALSDAVKLGPIEHSHVSETFTLVQNKYWCPSELRFSVDAALQLPVLPTFHLEHISLMQNYEANIPLADSLFTEQKHLVLPKADSTDSTTWSKLRTSPLTTRESIAYLHLDTIAKEPAETPNFNPLAIAVSLLIHPDVYQYNRVEGSRFELKGGFNDIDQWPLSVEALGAYGVGDNRFKYDATITQALIWHTQSAIAASYSSDGTFLAKSNEMLVPVLSVAFRMHDDRVRIAESRAIYYNTMTALVARSDFPDYYFAKGIDASLIYEPSRSGSITLGYRNELESTIDNVVAHFSIFDTHMPYRSNPPINDGRLSSLMLSTNYDTRWRRLTLYTAMEAELAGSVLGGDFTYSKVAAHLGFEIFDAGWGATNLQVHYGQFFSGQPGIQHLFIFESPVDFAGHTQAFLTADPHEFHGDRILQVYLQQNFYDLPTRALGLHFLDPLHLQWFGLFNLGASSISAGRSIPLAYEVQSTGATPYMETGFGIGNILNLLRFDFGWRLHHFETGLTNFTVRLTIGFSF